MIMRYWNVEANMVGDELSSGRTKPLICTCAGSIATIEDWLNTPPSGAGNNSEFVVKFCGSAEMTSRGRLCEFVAGLLAQAMDVPVVEPAIVSIPDDLIQLLPTAQKSIVMANPGRQYGSKFLGSGWVTYPKDKKLEKNLIEQALCIYVFDMMIQNVDRRLDRPNVLTDGEVIKTYDHELAFSFSLPIIGEQSQPWQVHSQLATQHVFFSSLKGRNLDIEQCVERIESLDGDIINGIRSSIPNEWILKDLDIIESHIFDVRDNADKFANEIVRVLK